MNQEINPHHHHVEESYTFESRFNHLMQIKDHSDFLILQEKLGVYCSQVKSNWIASPYFIDEWEKSDKDRVIDSIEKANELTTQLKFAVDSWIDYEEEEDRTWPPGFTLKVAKK
jgi:hypothetical protein